DRAGSGRGCRGFRLRARVDLPRAGRAARARAVRGRRSRARRPPRRASAFSVPGGGQGRTPPPRHPHPRGRAPATSHPDPGGAGGTRPMARIVVAGAGAIGASVAYHLSLAGARDVVLAERGEVAGGATAKAMGGVRQQFSTAAEVRLARESIAFFEQLGPSWFQQVGYLFLAGSPEGLAELDARRELQATLGVPVERVDPRFVAGLNVD